METTYLFSTPSFTSGFARTLDLFGQLNRYNTFDTGYEADYWALTSDKIAIQRDYIQAYSEVLGTIQELKEQNQTKLEAETID